MPPLESMCPLKSALAFSRLATYSCESLRLKMRLQGSRNAACAETPWLSAFERLKQPKHVSCGCKTGTIGLDVQSLESASLKRSSSSFQIPGGA